jgi:hypothetical protein
LIVDPETSRHVKQIYEWFVADHGSIIGWCQANELLAAPDGGETRRVHTYGPKWNLLPPEYEAV